MASFTARNSGLNPSFSQNRIAADIPGWTDDVDVRAGETPPATMSGSFTAVQIIADLDRPAADAPVGVRLLEMPARVVDDVPVDAVLLDVVGQQGLREISVVQAPYRRSAP